MNASAGIARRIAGQAPALGVGVVVVALALDSGGYGGIALGIAAAAAWLGVIVVALGPARERALSRPFAVAAAALAVLAVLTALSLGWSIDRGAGFADVVRFGAYLGAFVLAGLLFAPGNGRLALNGVAGGLVAVCLIALGSRLLDIGSGDAGLAAQIPTSAGRLSYPIGYWNALGAMAAMAIPVLAWLASDSRGRAGAALALAGIPPVVLVAYLTSSRGALIAAVLGAAVVIAAAQSRGRVLAGLVVGGIAAAPAVVVATLASGIVDSPGTATGRSEIAVCLALAAGIAIAAVAGPAGIARGGAIPIPRVRLRYVVAFALVALAGLIIIVGPGRIAGDFASTSGREAEADSGGLSVAGSGRAQFWSAALEASGEEPLKGIGSGSFGLYWNRHGDLQTPVQSAHSEPLELLAELGPIGLAAFVAFFAAVAGSGIRRARTTDGAAAGAALGLIVTGLVGILIDWTWDVPAVAVPVLIAAAVLTADAFDSDPESAAAVAGKRIHVPAPAFAVLAVAFAVPAIWAGGLLAVATNRLDASGDALAAGRLDEAAAAARSAASAEPWAAEPWLRLATIEQAAGNLEAARLNARRAIALSPEDFRPWLLASQLEDELGNEKAVLAYATRAFSLAPLVIQRESIEPSLGFSRRS